MSVFVAIIIATFIISLISFIGVLTFFLKEQFLNRILLYLVAFSAGALIGAAFLDLLPEAISGTVLEEEHILEIFLFSIFGFCAFFMLEQFLSWHHHHSMFHPRA